MKKKNLLLMFCLVFIIKSLHAEEHHDDVASSMVNNQEALDADSYEWEDGDNGFLDAVAGDVENKEKEMHHISLLDKAVIGAHVVWNFCIILPYQKIKQTYFDYVYPFAVLPFKNVDEYKNKKRKTDVA